MKFSETPITTIIETCLNNKVIKTFKGQENTSCIDVAKASKVLKTTASQLVAKLEAIEKAIGDGEKLLPPLYGKQTRVPFEQFQKAWNDAKGDPEECAKNIGNNDFGEPIVTKMSCRQRYDNAKRQEFPYGYLMEIKKTEGIGSINDELKAQLAEMFAAFSVGAETADEEALVD